MLVLTRKVDEAILIGDDIRICVLGVDGDRVSIGVDAPRSMRIFRNELLEETRDMNREAVNSSVNTLEAALSSRQIPLRSPE
ncbi:MAG: carbon storage regulator CsrA [Christensenellales bacterium]|jgi:carbon storage regulator|nr:carbon storage regulator CsrA [Clostridiales bacterium]